MFWRQSDHGHHDNLLCRSVFLHLCRIAYPPPLPAPHMPSVDATKKLVSSFVLSGLLQLFTGQSPGSPAESTTQCSSSCPWQTRARPRKAFAQIPPLVASPTSDWVQNSILCYRSRDSSGPAYLSGLFSVYQPSLSLRSADAGLMTVPRIKLNKYGKRAFWYIRPVTLISLPKPLRDAPSLFSFKSNLKTSLFESSCTEDIHSPTHQGVGKTDSLPCI